MLNLTNSNRTEALLAALIRNLRAGEQADPFATWQILVPSVGMRTLLQNQIAQHFGICANVEFSFLAQWLWRQVERVTEVAGQSRLTPDAIAWRIYSALQDQDFIAAHPRLASWLQSADPAMQYDLSRRIAALFDKTMTYRPEWTESWINGRCVELAPGVDSAGDQQWQMALWQRIANEIGLPGRHPFVEFLERLRSLERDQLAASGIPTEIHVFALPSIPPIYFRMLERLATQIDVHLYLLNPCREYWFDIVDPKRLGYLAAKGQETHLEVGNRLLAMWGRQNRQFLELLLQETVPDDDEACFIAPTADTLLGRLQSAILDMRELEAGSAADLAADGSIEFHCCHTLARELEVLQDRLLARFNDEDSELQPSQVLVVVPDLEQAAPLIDAVFGSATGARRIPYRITGRPASSANPIAAALLALLSIAGTRYYASQVFGLLQNPLIGARFGIGPADLDVILGWLPATQTHWGLDSTHRASFDAPAVRRHTFDEGLARLYLGYALPDDSREPFADLLAPGNVEGDDARILACFDQFVGTLSALEHRLARAANPGAWRATLFDIIERFLLPQTEHVADLESTRNAIAALVADMEAGCSDDAPELPLPVVRAALKEALDEPTRGGSPTGCVTFSALTSLRNLPYDTVCVLGMNDGAFPSARRPLEFDLLQQQPRAGDREPRDEERNLFLDLILAARSHVYISYTGRSVRDNSPLPPSVPVSDLLDYLAEATAADPDSRDSRAAARAALVLEHPLQPFSEAYFDRLSDPRLFSFNTEYCEALKQRRAAMLTTAQGKDDDARAAVESAPARATVDTTEPVEAGMQQQFDFSEPDHDSSTRHQSVTDTGADPDADHDADHDAGNDADEDDDTDALPLFFVRSLPPPETEWRSVTPAQLIEFYRNPCRYLLRRRMRLQLPDEALTLEDDASFLPDRWAANRLAQRLLPRLLEGESIAAIRPLATAGLEFPDGQIGEVLLEAELESLTAFAQQLRERVAAPVLPPISNRLTFEIEGEQWILEGALADVRADGLVRYRYADASANDYLSAWISHLFLNTCAGQPERTEWFARNGRIGLLPVPDAHALLHNLVRHYRRGLSTPLHFFPRSAWKWIKDDRRSAAASTWRNGHHPGEGDDPAYQLALRGHPDPLDDEFDALTHEIFGQMRRHLDGEPI